MATEFRELCEELARSLTPALTALGFTPAEEPFSRATLRYDFRRSSTAGTETFSVLFNKYRDAQFGVQLYVEPPGGLSKFKSSGGKLLVGGLSPALVYWPFGVRAFKARPTWWQRIGLGRAASPGAAVKLALSLLPEVERWWNVQRTSKHILTGRVVFPGEARTA